MTTTTTIKSFLNSPLFFLLFLPFLLPVVARTWDDVGAWRPVAVAARAPARRALCGSAAAA